MSEKKWNWTKVWHKSRDMFGLPRMPSVIRSLTIPIILPPKSEGQKVSNF